MIEGDKWILWMLICEGVVLIYGVDCCHGGKLELILVF